MKRIYPVFLVMLLLGTLVGCHVAPTDPTTEATAAPTTEATMAPTEVVTEPATEPTTEATTEPTTEPTTVPMIDYKEVYSQQLSRYVKAINERWDAMACMDNEISSAIPYYCQENGMENIGYSFTDLDADGQPELIIGAILNAQLDPVVFEIWTLVDNQPVMVAQSHERNRYCLAMDEQGWLVVYNASNHAANSATFYLRLCDGALTVQEAVVMDYMVNMDAPWFLSKDMDWDTTNDQPIDEATAQQIMQSYQEKYVAVGYTPYSQY